MELVKLGRSFIYGKETPYFTVHCLVAISNHVKENPRDGELSTMKNFWQHLQPKRVQMK